MKKIILSIIFLLFLTNVSAQNFDITLVSYNPETQNARIQIINRASANFNDIKMEIDNIVEIPLAETLGAGLSFSTFQTIYPGQHEITITTKEGISYTKKIYFPPSEKQIQQDVEKQKQALEQQKQTPQLPIKTAQESNRYIYSILAIIAVVIFYIIYRRLK